VAHQRDYAREYRQRLEAGQRRGVPRQIARGRHPEEGGRLPDGSRASIISLTEIRSGRLRAATLETMHRMNRGLRGPDAERWRRAALRRGWAVFANARGSGYHTIDDVPREILDGLRNRDRQYFFGY
jgi:hypothetical protein